MPDLPDVESYLDPAPHTRSRKYDEKSALNLISKYESGDQNIPNYRFDPGHTAQGFHQITNTNWRSFGPRAGINLRQYPSAMAAPRDVQEKVAGLMYRERGFQDWAPFNPRLKAAIARGEAGQQPQAPTGVESYLDPLPQQPAQPRPVKSPWGTGAIGRGVKPTRIAPRGISAARVEGEARPSEATATRGALRNIAASAGLPTGIPSAAGDLINEAVYQGAGQLLNAAGGVGTSRLAVSPITSATEYLANRAGISPSRILKQGARQIAGNVQAVDEDANRGVISSTAKDLIAGSIGSSPAMILTALGVPAPVAFGLQSNLEAEGSDASFKDVVEETAKGATIGALFELPLPVKQELLTTLQQRLLRAGIVGSGTAALTGSPTESLINAAFGGMGGKGRERTPETRAEVPRLAETEAQAAPEVAAITHPKLQRRLDDGTYGKETKAETEARRAQVESATPEPAPEELIRPPEAAVSPAELPPEAAQPVKAETTAPIPEIGRGLMESAYPESRGSIKDFKGEQITRGDERGAVLLPSRQQLVELGRAAIDVPSRISHQRIAGPIERMVEQHRAVRGVEFESERLKKETARQLTGLSPDEQIAIIDAMENDYKGPTWDALSLRQRQIATQLKPVHDMMAEYNRKFDVFTEREMPEGVRHIFHWWNDPKTGRPYETQWGEFSKTGPSSRQRTIETYAEGRAKGLEQASTNPGEILGKSFEQMVRVKEARDLIDNLKVWKLGELNGLVKEIPKGLEDRYERVEIPALKPTVYVPKGEGAGLLVKQPVYALKELVPKLRAYFEKPEWTKFDEVMSAAKSLKLSLSFFHGLGLTFKNMTMFRFRSIHDIRNGLKFMEGMDGTMKRLYSNGLETALTKDYSDLIDATGHFHRKTLLGRVSDITHKNPMSRLIFSYVRVGLKNAYAHDTYGKMEPRYIRRMEKQIGRPLTDVEMEKARNQAARAVVERASNLFSGEDKRLGALEASDLVTRLYFNPKAQRIWQKALISPTWQREHMIEAKNLAKSIVAPGMMGPIAREHIKQAFGATTLLAVADLTNYFITRWQDEDHKGKHLWENPTGSKFSVRLPWDEPEYSVTDKNGKERKVAGGPAFVRPFKAITEVPEVAAALFAKEGERDIVDKLSAKVHPWLQAAAEQMQFSGEKRKQGMLERGKALATSVAPIAADQPMRVLKGQRTPLDLIPWVIGAPTQKPVQTKPSEEVSRPTRSRRPTRRSR